AALENIAIGNDAFVIGPFTKELADPGWISKELSRLGSAASEVDTRVVIVHLQDEDAYLNRIRARGSELDRWKLANWSEFSKSLALRQPQWDLPEGSILYIDNTLTSGQDNPGTN